MSELGFAVLGTGFMGGAHSRALHALRALPDRPRPRLISICGRDRANAERARDRYGWLETAANWRAQVSDERVAVFDNTGPNHLHLEPALAAIRNAKHVICEKPSAPCARDARRLWVEAERAGVVSMCAFNLRFVPAVRLARELIAAGELGAPTHFRARFLASSALSRDQRRTWRFERAAAGSGAVADLGSHLVDLCRYLAGEPEAVTAATRTFVTERDGQRVDVDDAFAAVIELEGGAIGTLEASRAAGRRSNECVVEVDGTLGSLRIDFERLNDLELCTERKRWTRIDVTSPADPFMRACWWPEPGHGIGWGDPFMHELRHLISAVAKRGSVRPHGADFEDGYRCAETCDAILRAAESGEREAVAFRDIRRAAAPA